METPGHPLPSIRDADYTRNKYCTTLDVFSTSFHTFLPETGLQTRLTPVAVVGEKFLEGKVEIWGRARATLTPCKMGTVLKFGGQRRRLGGGNCPPAPV